MVWPFKYKLLSATLLQGTIYCKFFLQNEIQVFFSCVYNSSLTFQAAAVSYSCTTQEICHLSNLQTCDLQ